MPAVADWHVWPPCDRLIASSVRCGVGELALFSDFARGQLLVDFGIMLFERIDFGIQLSCSTSQYLGEW